MKLKIFAMLSITLAAALVSGCKSHSSQIGAKETNILGIVKVEKAVYAHTPPTTIALNTNELFSRQDISGDRVTLLWGLITLQDY